MKKFLKAFCSVVAPLFLVFVGFFAYFAYTMTIGDTYGLYEKLEKLDNVVSVQNYRKYEGSAFFTLLLTKNRQITLSVVGNQDLVKSDGMMLEQFGSYEIMCTYSSGGFSVGIPTAIIGNNYLNQECFANIQNMITHYEEIENFFSTMPFKMYLKTDQESGSANSFIICKNRPEKNDLGECEK